MEPHEFQQLADQSLEQVIQWLEGFDPDELDFNTADGVVTMEFADGTRFVLNRQSAANQMWFAAGVRAWHYDRDPQTQRWRCDKDGHDLLDCIATVVGQKLGRSVTSPAANPGSSRSS
jgi:CyaY protein